MTDVKWKDILVESNDIKVFHWSDEHKQFYLEFKDGTLRYPRIYHDEYGRIRLLFMTHEEFQQKADELKKKRKWWKIW